LYFFPTSRRDLAEFPSAAVISYSDDSRWTKAEQQLNISSRRRWQNSKEGRKTVIHERISCRRRYKKKRKKEKKRKEADSK
jgi:hypothetical protein